MSKRYGETVVLRDVSLELVRGEVHALLGANGSGKSTLIKVLSGAVSPMSGSLRWEDVRSSGFPSPAQAAAIGIRVVHQESPLIDNATVLEAVATFRGYGARSLGRIRWRRLRREVSALLESLDVRVRLDELCSRISPADRAGLALAVAVDDRGVDEVPTRLLLLDEVTAPIPARQAEQHLDRVRLVADSGVAVLMVTHRLGELRIADDVTIVRDGKIVYREAGGPRLSHSKLIDEVVGHETPFRASDFSDQHSDTFPDRPARARGPVSRLWQRIDASGSQRRRSAPVSQEAAALSLRDIVSDRLHGLSLEVRRGEVVGFVGLEEAGISELPRILSGALPRRAGDILVGGRRIAPRASPREMISAGITVVPADRLRNGGVGILSTEENVILPSLSTYWHRRQRKRAAVSGVIDAFDVRPRDPRALFGSLSGGNQQKVLLGKWLLLRPDVLVLDDPTYGIDPGARETVFEAMLNAARLGICVLFFSTEPEQLARVCGRVLVLRSGAVETELTGPALTEEGVARWSYA